MAETYSAGIVTAYGAAVRGGYTGTYDEFCAEQAGFAENAQQVAEDRAAVEQQVSDFGTVTVPAAEQQIAAAGAAQVAAVNAAGQDKETDIAAAGAAQVTRVETTGTQTVGSVETAGSQQVAAVNAAGAAQVAAVAAEGTTQTGAVQAKGQEILDSIPEDYTALVDEVAKNAAVFVQTLDQQEAPDITIGSVWRSATGTAGSNVKYARTTRKLTAALYNTCRMISDTYRFGLGFYDSAGNPFGFVIVNDAIETQYVPDDAVQMIVNFNRKDNADMQDSDIEAIQSALKLYGVTDTKLEKPGKAADAQATGWLRKKINACIQIEPKTELNLRSGGLAENGAATSNTSYIRTVGASITIPTPLVETGDFYNVLYPYEARVAIYQSTSITTAGFVAWVNAEWKTGDIPIPDSYAGNYAAIVIRKIGYETADISGDVETITNYVTYANIYAWAGEIAKVENASVSMFGKIGACGASWETGLYFYGSTTAEHESDYKVSWVANLARRNGAEYAIYARSGLNVKTWLTDPNGLNKMLSDTPCDLYILAFGRSNDSDRGLDKLGTKDDIGTDADTYYRYFAEIVSAVKEHAPQAIIISTCNNGASEERNAYYNATIELSDLCGIAFIDWHDDPWYTGSFMQSTVSHSHPTPVSYSGIACCFERLFSKCVVKYLDYFKSYHAQDPDNPITE